MTIRLTPSRPCVAARFTEFRQRLRPPRNEEPHQATYVPVCQRLSINEMKGNQLRLDFSALVCTLVEALPRLALKGTQRVQVQVNTIRLKMLKISAVIQVRVVWPILERTAIRKPSRPAPPKAFYRLRQPYFRPPGSLLSSAIVHRYAANRTSNLHSTFNRGLPTQMLALQSLQN